MRRMMELRDGVEGENWMVMRPVWREVRVAGRCILDLCGLPGGQLSEMYGTAAFEM